MEARDQALKRMREITETAFAIVAAAETLAAEGEEGNWAAVGSMGHVAEELKDLARFLGCKERS